MGATRPTWHAARTTGGVAIAAYTPRDPSASVLYGVVREHIETFRAEASRRHEGCELPRFVDEEFRAFLRCGFLAGGFARFRCGDCRAERLVAFSCKGRGFCPSCGGRRMAERAAHLVEHVLPDVPVRQWVLTLPHRLRYALAWRHDLCRVVVRLLHRAIARHRRDWARRHGLRHAQSGGVAVLQRFGGALNLNVHVHALVLDGVFVRASTGRLAFHAAPAPSPADVAEILATLVAGVQRLVAREGLEEEGTADALADASSLLAEWTAASVQSRVVDGDDQRRPRRVGTAPAAASEVPVSHAQWAGYDLHAGVRVPAGHRDRLERVCRYALRPAVAAERLTRTGAGDVAVELRRPWADGTTALVFTPRAFLARLAVLVPRPRVNLLLYQGVLAPRAAWRAEVVPRPVADATATAVPTTASPGQRRRGWRWADLMRRVFAADVLACPRCGGRLRFLATLEASEATRRILQHLGLPTEVPSPAPSRAPPRFDDWAA